jgi:hypothetical protein
MPTNPRVTLITPHSDRPVGLALCEKWMARQTYLAAGGRWQWILVDDGAEPARPTMGQLHLRRPPGDNPKISFTSNLLAAVPHVAGDLVMVIEDDDWYAPNHVQDLVDRMGRAMIAGGIWQQYYHLPTRRHITYRNKGASLCQTGFRRELLRAFDGVCRQQREVKQYGVDGSLWALCVKRGMAVDNGEWFTSIGIKGLPGKKGLGLGHRPEDSWDLDADGSVLRKWVGNDADVYEALEWPMK